MSFDSDQDTLKILKKRYAESSRRTVFFIGAGCSVEVGLPDWWNLAAALHERLDSATPASALTAELLEKFNEADEFRQNGKFWEYFQTVEENWRTVYEDFLSETFSSELLQKCDIPSVYKKIWRMRNVGQVLTLNIDGLLKRAYDAVSGINFAQIFEFPGVSVTDSKSYFARNYPVILNLHGIYTHRSTWVMNSQERAKLFSGFGRGEYKSFLRHIFETYNIVFIGVNIRDVAISPIIEEISNSDLTQDHFWITPNISRENFTWAQQKGVRVIDYKPENSDNLKQSHSAVICAILDEIERYKSFDSAVILPEREMDASADFPLAKDFLPSVMANPMEARSKLDARIEYIGQNNGFNGRQMSSFVAEYSVPIELSSVIGKNEPYNKIGNLEISSSISESNSSNVWLARNTENESLFAIKTLSGQAFKDNVERESFRRGIESLYQLNRASSSVAPRFIFHTNTPLSIAMEYIEGASLSDHQNGSKNFIQDNWHFIFEKICRALLVCHVSEGEVLHRDIKPKNIILEGAYVGCDIEEFISSSIRFINFDMSWHKFSAGNTKSVSADEVGYYSPEQRNIINSDSPRTAKTDIYMLGMTLLSIISDQPPPEGGSRIKDWDAFVNNKIFVRLNRDRLVATRVSRLIINMTNADSDARPDLRSVISDWELIGFAMRNEWAAADPDLFVEKVLTEIGYDHNWDEDRMCGKIISSQQVELSLGYVARGQRMEMKWMRQRDDGTDRKNFGGKLGELSSKVRLQLTGYGWEVEEGGGHHSRSILATIRVRDLVDNWLESVSRVREVVKRLMGNV